MNCRIIPFLFAFSVTAVSAFSQNKADDIAGIWLTPGDNSAKIEIYRYADRYVGKIAWMKNPNENGKPKTDWHNPDKNKRNTPRLGLVIMTGFKFNGEDEWRGGHVYDPETGNTYSAYLYLKGNNTLKLRGYIGFSFLGRTETWIRAN